MTKDSDATPTALTEISDRGLISHLGAGFHPVNAQFDVSTGSLPYPPSNGPWLERLCFLLLRSQGFVPRYFGNSGQKDRGVDLLVTSGDQFFVYQCKNVQSFLPGDMEKALNRFEDEWLKSSGLPKPNKFILCCPSLLRERVQNEDWTKLERDFQSRTGVEVKCWHRDFLDETLKSLPDIVAEVFSDQVAKLFCECDDWNYDQFSPVVTDSPDRYIKRYQERKAADRIYLAPDLAAEFTEKLERNGSVLIMGLPGSGKTTTSFALAEELPNRRTYYVTLRENISDNDLVNGVRNRLSRQTIFLVDDCQGRFGQLDSVMNRVNRLLQGRRNQAFFVFLTRTTPTPGDLVRGDEMTDFEEGLKEADAVLRFTADQQTFRRIIEQTKPEFGSLSDELLESIYEFTGHDLFLLDEMLETIDDERGIDDLNVEFLFRKTIARYFGKGTVDRPGFMNLAALAQFEIAPRVAGFPIDLETEDARAAAELVVQAGRPPRYFFLHSSAAELIFRALVKNDGIEDHAGKAAGYLIQFFKSRSPDDKALADDLSKAIRNHLKLADDEAEENRLKSAFLGDDAIYSVIERSFETLPLNLVASCLIALKNSSSPVLEGYLALVRGKIEDGAVLKSAATRPFWESNLFLWLMKRHYQPLFIILSKQFSGSGNRSLLKTTDLPDYLKLLSTIAGSEKHVWFESLNIIPDDEIEAMIQRTMNAGRSIGMISWYLRELKQHDEALLTRLEEKIGAERLLSLIAANGSIYELFMQIQFSSLPMAERLIDALDDPLLDQLVEQTISSGRSIGNIHWTLRELKQNAEPALTRLEEKISAARFLRLITANGSVFELFSVIQNSSLAMAEKLIAALDDALLDQLVEQTISSRRSVGTLHLTLRELKQNDEALLTQLEEKIGAARFLRLIAANGSIFELFRVIQYSSLPMAEKLIVALDDALLDRLVTQTISLGRSIGTLNFALRELKQNDEALLTRLEEKIGAARLLRLIAANGSIIELFGVIQDASLPMAEMLIAALDDPLLDQLLEQTISSGRSIGSLHWTLGYLKRANSMLLRRLEEKISEVRWWRLVYSFGSISILVELLPAMDKSFRQRFERAATGLSFEEWQKLLLQRDFYELCYFVKNVPFFFSAKFRPDFLKPIFVTLIQTGNWKARNTGWSLLSAAEESVAKNYLVKLLYEQIGDTQPTALSFPSFADAAHCVNLLWRLFPEKRKELLDALHRFFAEGKPIYSDLAYLGSVRLLFSTLATPQAESEDARVMLAIGNAPAVAPLCSKATTLDIFLYLWNLYALWFGWKSPQETSFVGFLRVEIVDATIASLPKRFRAAKDEKETGNLITLTGLLSFLCVTFDRPSAAEDFVSRLPSFDKMIERLDEDRPFIPAFFYLLGLEWLYQNDRGVPAVVWWDELGKANDYPETTAALYYLKGEATKRSRAF